MTIPIHSANYDNLVPDWYEIQHQSSHCTRCNRNYDISVTFAVNTFMVGKAKTLNKRPISEVKWQRPINIISGKTIPIPLCHECAKNPHVLSHLPLPVITPKTPPSWVGKGEADKPKPTPKKKEPPKPPVYAKTLTPDAGAPPTTADDLDV